MGYLEKELEDIASLSNQIDAGTAKPELVMLKVALWSKSEKRMDLLLRSMAQGANTGKHKCNRLSVRT